MTPPDERDRFTAADDLPPIDEALVAEAAATLESGDPDSGIYFGLKPEKVLVELTDRVVELGAGAVMPDATSLLDRMLSALSDLGGTADERRSWWSRLLGRRPRSWEARLREAGIQLDRLAAELESLTNPLLTERATLGRFEDRLKAGIADLDAYIQGGLSRLEDLKGTAVFDDLLYRLEDMRMARTIACQNLAAIQVMRANRAILAEKIQFVLERALPLWHHQARFAVIYMALLERGESSTGAETEALSRSELSRSEASELLAELEPGGATDAAHLVQALNRRLVQALEVDRPLQHELQGHSHKGQT